MSPRPRERILANLETIYREAYERAKQAKSEERKADLDASFQREQLILEVLLDIRDTLAALDTATTTESTIDKLAAIRKLGKLTKP